jgi:hypothetical protein
LKTSAAALDDDRRRDHRPHRGQDHAGDDAEDEPDGDADAGQERGDDERQQDRRDLVDEPADRGVEAAVAGVVDELDDHAGVEALQHDREDRSDGGDHPAVATRQAEEAVDEEHDRGGPDQHRGVLAVGPEGLRDDLADVDVARHTLSPCRASC